MFFALTKRARLIALAATWAAAAGAGCSQGPSGGGPTDGLDSAAADIQLAETTGAADTGADTLPATDADDAVGVDAGKDPCDADPGFTCCNGDVEQTPLCSAGVWGCPLGTSPVTTGGCGGDVGEADTSEPDDVGDSSNADADADTVEATDSADPDAGSVDVPAPGDVEADANLPDTSGGDTVAPADVAVDVAADVAVDAGTAPGVFTPTGCTLKVNANTAGTVNPFISPARDGQFYVSYAAIKSVNGSNVVDLLLDWVTPQGCKIVQGPFQVNKVDGEVYYWGSQAVVSDMKGNFYAVWEAKKPSGVAFAWSTTGKDFTQTALINSTSENGLYPQLFVPSPGDVHVVWSGLYNGQYDPFWAHNPGVFDTAVWSMGKLVSASKLQDDSVSVVLGANGTIFVGWETFEGDLYVSRSTDKGATWSPPAHVNDVDGKAGVGKGSFLTATPDGRVVMMWKDERKKKSGNENDVFADSSVDGLTWGTDVQVNDNDARYQEDPSMTVGFDGPCKGTVYAVWQDFRSKKDYEIYASRSKDGGLTWEANQLVTPVVEGDKMNPAIAIDSSCMVGVAWRDSTQNEKFDIQAAFFKW